MKWLALAIFVLAAGAAVYVLNQGQPPSSVKNDQPRDAQAFLADNTENPPQDNANAAGQSKTPKATSPDVAFPLGADGKPSDKKSATSNVASSSDGEKDSGDSAADRAARRRRRRMEETSAGAGDDNSGGTPTPSAFDTSASASPGYITASAGPTARASASPSPATSVSAASGAPTNTTGSGSNGVTLGGALISGGFITTPAGAAAPSAAASKPASTAAAPASNSNTAANTNKAPMRMLPIANAKTPATVSQGTNMDFKRLAPMNPPLMAMKKPLDLGDMNGNMYADKIMAPSDTPPADFIGIYASPKSVTLPAAGSTETEKKAVAVTSQKSGFTPQDKPSVELSRDCEASITAACDTNIPDGGPSVMGYVSGGTFMKDDLIPDTKAFDIGTTTVSTAKDPETGKEISTAEISVQIDPGKVPGRYTVRVALGTQKIYATSFEVLAAASPQAIQSLGAAIAEPLSNVGNTTRAPKTQTPP